MGYCGGREVNTRGTAEGVWSKYWWYRGVRKIRPERRLLCIRLNKRFNHVNNVNYLNAEEGHRQIANRSIYGLRQAISELKNGQVWILR